MRATLIKLSESQTKTQAKTPSQTKYHESGMGTRWEEVDHWWELNDYKKEWETEYD